MASWYDMLSRAMQQDGEVFETRKCTLDEAALRVEFDDGYGDVEGSAFTAWGETWVYFPICYDGSEYVGHAPRNPCAVAMKHQGNEHHASPGMSVRVPHSS